MRFSQQFIERVQEANNIVDVIGMHTQLKRSGARHTGLCPFPDHNEKTPSFSVAEDKQLYYCFGCKKSGNIYNFVQALQGLSFPEAVEYLAQRAAIEIPIDADAGSKPFASQREKKSKQYKVNERVCDHFHRALLAQSPASAVRKYCVQRGLTEELIKQFKIGYAPNQWHEVATYLDRIGAPLEEAENLGLIRKSKKSDGYFDLFRDRLIFPIIAPTGQVLGFGGRQLGDDQPKYLNSPESNIFHKGSVFYGLNEAAKFIRTSDRVIVVEGYMDYLALFRSGICNVVATLGTALTRDHAKLIKRYTKNVTVLFDGDDAGKVAAERSLPILLEESLLPKAYTLPQGMDPDDYLQQKGVKNLSRALSRAPELFTEVLERKMEGYTGQSTEKVSLMDQVARYLAATKDFRLRDLYIAEVVDRLNVEATWVKGSIKRAMSGTSGAETVVSEPPVTQTEPASVEYDEGFIEVRGEIPRAEVLLLNLALMKEVYFKQIWDAGVVTKFSHAQLKEVFLRAEARYRQEPSKFDKLTALLVGQVKPAQVVNQHLEHPLVGITEEGAQKLIQDCSRKVQEDFEKVIARELLNQLRHADPKDQREKLEQFMNIQRERRGMLPKDVNSEN